MPQDTRNAPADENVGLTYRGSGVDIDAGHEVVRRIRAHVESTRRPEVLSEIGGFAGLCGLPTGLVDPVLVSCADGVGSKLLVAITTGRHDTVGIDLVAMNVNDLLVCGARPLFFLDYVACHRVEPPVIEAIVAGIARGCREGGVALLGGETAELPDLYAPTHYDLAGFVVGAVSRRDLWNPSDVHEGDVVLGLASSGLHSNGYSLARKALLDPAHGGLSLDDPLDPSADAHVPGPTIADALLEPTRIYTKAFTALWELEGRPVHGAAHITGGGLVDNPHRPLPDHLGMTLDLTDVPLPTILRRIQEQGVSTEELRRTFNCGLGMLLVVAPERVGDVRKVLQALGEPTFVVGTVVPCDASSPRVRFL